jgi:16S rRNA (cytosine967-C5)-methyltransferase
VTGDVGARRLAWQVLRDVHARDAYGNLALSARLRRSELDDRDRALVTELSSGTLRAEGTLDAVLAHCVTRPLTDVDPPLLDVLRLGTYQLLRTRVPAHAAVATAVDLAREVAGEGPAKFANAVLRRVAAREGDLGLPAYDEDPVGHLALLHAHPRWMVEAFRDALGGDLAETAVALAADDLRPAVHLVARPGRLTSDELLAECLAAGLTAKPGRLSPYAVLLESGEPGLVPSVRSGAAGVQDEGSQLAALAAAHDLPPAARVLDACAGPGGKSALLAGLLPSGGVLLAADVHPHRAGLVNRVLAGSSAGAAGRAATVVADARRPAWRPGAFDAVLVDAPCTGLGSLRRRPEARWRRLPEHVEPLHRLQRVLLARAVSAVRRGGRVTYVVCSPHLREGRDVVADVVAARADVEVVDIREVLGPEHLGGRMPDGPTLQLWPHRDGTDAMFVAVLRRA